MNVAQALAVTAAALVVGVGPERTTAWTLAASVHASALTNPNAIGDAVAVVSASIRSRLVGPETAPAFMQGASAECAKRAHS